MVRRTAGSGIVVDEAVKGQHSAEDPRYGCPALDLSSDGIETESSHYCLDLNLSGLAGADGHTASFGRFEMPFKRTTAAYQPSRSVLSQTRFVRKRCRLNGS